MKEESARKRAVGEGRREPRDEEREKVGKGEESERKRDEQRVKRRGRQKRAR